MLQFAVTDQSVMMAELEFHTERSDHPQANNYRVAEKHRTLILPSFSTGAISVGFGIRERIASSSSFSCRERHTGRIARDDANGSLLFLVEDPNLNIVEITSYNICTPTNRGAVSALFQADLFKEALATMRTPHFDVEALKKALIYFYHSAESRPCPQCGAASPAPCPCKLPLDPKRHPLDRDADIRNIVSYTGTYHGMASLGLYKKGKPVFSSKYASSSSVQFTSDFVNQQKLSLWALCAAAQTKDVNPIKIILSEAAAMKGRFVTATDTFLLHRIVESVTSTENGEETLRALAASKHLIPSNDFPVSAIGLSGALAHMSSVSTTLPGVDANSFMAGFSHSHVTRSPSHVTGVADAEESVNQRSRGSDSKATSVGPSLSDDFTAPGDSTVMDMMDMELGDTALDMSQPLPPMPHLCGQGTTMAHPKQPLMVRPVTLAPARKDDEATRAKEKAQAELEEQRRKIELRKARNRESAHRSNLKRKMQIQKLKDEIEAANSRETYLRAREKMLREENMSLRTAAFR